jgi:hypothetical protein
MKTTLEIPDPIFRRAKAAAAERGIPFRALVSEALADKLRGLHAETAKINRIIQEEFGRIEPEDRD